MQPRRDLLAVSDLRPPLPSKLEMHPTRDDYQVKSQSRLHENSKRWYFFYLERWEMWKKIKTLNVQYGLLLWFSLGTPRRRSSQWAFLFSTTTYSFAFKQRNTPGAYLPADVRFCLSFHERFYYDSVDNQCKTYSWGGCLGNANYFAAADDCLASCAWSLLLLVQVRRHRRTKNRTYNLLFLLVRWFGSREFSDQDAILLDVKENEIVPRDSVCRFGNETINLGDRFASEDPCEESVCSTPPEITCTRHTCPAPPEMPNAVCQSTVVPGQCCPDHRCLQNAIEAV